MEGCRLKKALIECYQNELCNMLEKNIGRGLGFKV
jgi:hypothetical protein